MRNSRESELQFVSQMHPYLSKTKQSIITLVDSLFDDHQPLEWELKLDKDDIRVFVKKQTAKDAMPIIKTEITFNQALAIRKIVRAVSPTVFMIRSSTLRSEPSGIRPYSS